MAIKGKPYRSIHQRELERIEARRVAAGVTLAELCDKSQVSQATYRRMRGSGRAFKRHVNALSMAMRTLEGERRRDDELFPFGAGR